MSCFDEEPDGDPHGECAAEIARLKEEIAMMTAERDALKHNLAEHKAICASLNRDLHEALNDPRMDGR